jgi:hypothetical protein
MIQYINMLFFGILPPHDASVQNISIMLLYHAALEYAFCVFLSTFHCASLIHVAECMMK